MKKFRLLKLFVIIMSLLLASLFTSVSPVFADSANDFKVSSKNGVVYVTTDPDPTAVARTSSSTNTATPSGRNIKVDIQAPRGFAQDIGYVINFVLRIVIVIAVLLVFGYIVLGAFAWITSGGEKGKTEAAKNQLLAAVAGLIIVASSYAILTILLRMLGFTDLNSVLESVGTINSVPPVSSPVVTAQPTPSPQLR